MELRAGAGYQLAYAADFKHGVHDGCGADGALCVFPHIACGRRRGQVC
jgi:hypothetical protein